MGDRKQIHRVDFGLRQHRVNDFQATVPTEVRDNLEDPALWANMGPQLRVNSSIQADADDGTWTANIRVKYAEGNVVRVKVLEVYELGSLEELEPLEEFVVRRRGPKGWCICRTEDNEIIFGNLPSQAEAQKQLEDYVKALAA